MNFLLKNKNFKIIVQFMRGITQCKASVSLVSPGSPLLYAYTGNVQSCQAAPKTKFKHMSFPLYKIKKQIEVFVITNNF